MTHCNTLTRQGGKATPLELVVKVVVICAIGAAAVLLANGAANTGDRTTKLPVSSAHAAGTDATRQALPSSAQAKSWDPVQYAPDDFEPLPGQIEY